MRLPLALALGVWLSSVGFAQPVEARRVALAIGNSAYAHAEPLPNPVNDATAMAVALEGVGFEVVRGIDLDRQATVRTLSEFAGRLVGAEVGLFFYAGHGMQVNGVNYLVPVDAELTREADVFLSLVSLEQVLQVMETEVPTRLVFLDACRDNPLACSLSRTPGATGSTAVGQGLARMDKAVDTTLLERLQAAAAAVSQQPAEEATVAALPVRPPAEPRSAVPAPGSVIEDCAHCPEQVVVPAGRFRMGSAPG